MFNDRNLVIVCITLLVACYIVATGGDTASKDIIEKAIIALGSLATGSILGNATRFPKEKILSALHLNPATPKPDRNSEKLKPKTDQK